MELTGKQKRHLRGLGHGLKPIVSVGKQGLTKTVIEQVDACLTVHELIKVKLLEGGPAARGEAAQQITQRTGSALAQSLGRTLLLYRPHPEKPGIELPG